MNCWYSVKDFPKSLFVDHDAIVEYVTRPQQSWICTFWNAKLIHSSVHEWLASYDLKFNRALAFYRHDPADQGVPHIDTESREDGKNIPCPAGINVEIMGRGTMDFFSGDESDVVHKLTPRGQPYAYFPNIGDSDIIDSNDFSCGTSLVRTDVVHCVSCFTAPRLLLSFRFRNLDNSLLSWDETVARLNSSLVER